MNPDNPTTIEHELKTWPQFFQKILDGIKPFEIRKNDRNFRVGDSLFLREWNPETGEYTGRSQRRTVSYIYPEDGYGDGVNHGYCVMGLNNPTTTGEWTAEKIAEIWRANGGWILTSNPFEALAKAINAALAAEREKWSKSNDECWRDIQQLREQLAAEREKYDAFEKYALEQTKEADAEIQQLREQLAVAVDALKEMETKHGYIPEVLMSIHTALAKMELAAEREKHHVNRDNPTTNVPIPGCGCSDCMGNIPQETESAEDLEQQLAAAVGLLKEAHERLGNTAFPSLSARIATALAKIGGKP